MIQNVMLNLHSFHKVCQSTECFTFPITSTKIDQRTCKKIYNFILL